MVKARVKAYSIAVQSGRGRASRGKWNRPYY